MSDTLAPQALPTSWDWRDHSGVTPVKNQSTCGACYAFGGIANFESRVLIDGGGTHDYSENNAKECNWRETHNYQDPPGMYWGSCDGGNYYMLVTLFSQKGVVNESCDPYQVGDVACNSGCAYQKTLLGWNIISGGAIPSADTLKTHIYNYGPVYTTVYVDSAQGFDGSYDGSYTFNYTTPSSTGTNHAVMIVGWSNNLPPVQGSKAPASGWIVKNSWGSGWGDNGYFYITYGSANIGMYSSYAYDWQDYDTQGDIWYYDDDGWTYSWGYGTTTAWGLDKYIPDKTTYVTRVEFWTTDETTDIDLYIYDDFDGSTLSNLLWSSPNHSFAQAGYHSVEVDPPLAVTNGDDVIVVAKFTNASFVYPVAADKNGTAETGRTYLSSNGVAWSDMGSAYSNDIAIRLRTSDSVGTPDVTITKRALSPTFNPGAPVTFVLGVSNGGDDIAYDVVVTDTIPSDITASGFASTLNITRHVGTTYIWDVEPLGVGETGVISIYGHINSGLPPGFTIVNKAYIGATGDGDTSNNFAAAIIGGRKVFMPLVMRSWP